MTSSTLHLLLTRANNDDDDSCRSFEEDNQAEPISGTLTTHKLNTYISAAAMIICCASTFSVIAGHLLAYRQPSVQKQLIRMILMMPVFAIFSFLGVLSYHLTPYMIPIAHLYEAFALIAAFYLMATLLTPGATSWKQQCAFFALPENGGRANYTKTYISVMQLLPGRVVTTIAAIAISALHCDGGKAFKRGRTIITVINAIQTAIALVALFKFLKRWIRQLKIADTTIVRKLACFKVIIVIGAVQSLVLSILTQADVLHPTRTVSYNDMNFGIGCTLICIEAAIVGLIVIWAFWPGQYRNSVNALEAGKAGQQAAPETTRLSPLRAVLDVVNMADVISGVFRAFQLFVARRRTQEPAPAYTPRATT